MRWRAARPRVRGVRMACAVAWGMVCTVAGAAAADPPAGLSACRLKGVEHGAWCGHIARPLDPERPAGPAIDVHFAVLPALARHKHPDPVFFFAGGPGQSAVETAGTVARLLGRFGNRRDVVLVDQRGTGRSAPLRCAEPHAAALRPLREQVDPAQQRADLLACLAALRSLPHGDPRQYTTTIAVQDVDAVRQRLGAARINLVGASYGTRAALEYLRQFPQAVRRIVLDGVAPPDMVLPLAASTDGQAALDALFAACAAEPACRTLHPALRERWQALLASLPRTVTVVHPATRADESLTLTREMLLSLVRAPLYLPALASALPLALDEAAQGRFTALFGLAAALPGAGDAMAQGLHFSVICAEDAPRFAATADRPGADFGDSLGALYRGVCTDWPRGAVPAGFYRMAPAPVAALLLSGGLDPATPPRHGERVAQALGAKARHVVVPNAGHGLLAIACLRDAVFRFVDAESDDEAQRVDMACAAAVPRPPTFLPRAAAAAR
jgi:pimeloyl-ACP methyl ester carboxylesterase